MTPERKAYEAGRAARERGHLAGSNPHDDWSLGVAWTAGWHMIDQSRLSASRRVRASIEHQTGMVEPFLWGCPVEGL